MGLLLLKGYPLINSGGLEPRHGLSAMGSCSNEAHHQHKLDLACLPCAVLVFDEKGNLVARNSRAADLHSGTQEASKGHSSRQQ